MPRYYFYARGPNRYMVDHVGYELSDLTEAREYAFETIRDMASDPLASDPFHWGDYRHWAIHIKDEEGRTFVIIPFIMAL